MLLSQQAKRKLCFRYKATFRRLKPSFLPSPHTVMDTLNDQSFRLFDLPRELRDLIYRIMLGSFEPANTRVELASTTDPSSFYKFTKAKHSVETAILRTSLQVHVEAYDAMLKMKSFVLVRSIDNVPSQEFFYTQRVPVVSSDEGHVAAFKG